MFTICLSTSPINIQHYRQALKHVPAFIIAQKEKNSNSIIITVLLWLSTTILIE